METSQTIFEIKNSSRLFYFISGKTFKNDEDFLDSLEDFLFGKIIEEGDIGDYVEEFKILEILDKNIGK